MLLLKLTIKATEEFGSMSVFGPLRYGKVRNIECVTDDL